MSLMSTIIYATGTCFDDAIEYVEARVKLDPTLALRNDFVVAHAIIDPNPDGGPLAHAWVEDGPTVIFRGIFNGEPIWCTVDKAEYLAAANVLDITRYTMRDVLGHAQAHNFETGPWKPEYRRFCR